MQLYRIMLYSLALGFFVMFFLSSAAHAEMTIHVNKETHTLTLFKDGTNIARYDIIIGRPQTPTPSFVTQFQTIDINPTWNPTPSEIRQISKHSDMIKFNGILFTNEGKMYSPGGPRNPLGKARLNLEYEIKVRIHGTNEPDLFKTKRRNYSHGCIRVLEIKDLVTTIVQQYKIDDINWNQKYTIKLPEEVRVIVD